ncbi:hypothetical protein COCNU_02G016770 [Cocos nucifera]|uniref:Uncharacterized protein n=1 Tax=Cocos nucifera TaxID=13894 RepID=A0A8K0I1C0_COCNU|nr:hypothetical protein COCNU_02G016770 [Cocos nucifera]
MRKRWKRRRRRKMRRRWRKKKRKEEEEKRVQEEKEEDKKKREHEEKNRGEEGNGEEEEEGGRKKKEEKKVEVKKNKEKKTKREDKPKLLTYSLERRIKKEHKMRKAFHLTEDLNYDIRILTKKTKIEPKFKEGFIEHSHDYQDKGSLSEKDDAIIKMFLSERINSKIIFNNVEGGNITRSNLHYLLFARMKYDILY